MNRLFIIIALLLLTPIVIFAQDTIIQKNGIKTPCLIQNEDSTNVHFYIKRKGRKILTFLNKEEIDSIKYGIIKEPIPFDKGSLGAGLGLDYGGIGLNFTFFPQENIGLFAAYGYAMVGLSFNAGAKYRYIPNKTATVLPYAIAMYGYNTAIKVKNWTNYNKLYYGATVGVGLEFHSKSKSIGYWTVAMLVPIRDPKAKRYIDELKSNPNIDVKSEPWPVVFSVGYRLILD